MALRFRYLFVQLVREEWRLHTSLFGGRRFALFPAFVAALTVGTTAFFSLAGADGTALVAGLHVLVFLAGLHVGTIGLVGRDALEDLLGETTLLLFSARTLPVSERRLLLAFLVKDVAYYAVLFVLPLSVGLAPLVVLTTYELAAIPLALLTTTWTFGLGAATSLALVSVYTRSRLAVLAAVAALAAGVAFRGQELLALTPYGLVVDPRPLALLTSVVLTVVLSVAGIALFEFDRRTPARTADNRFRSLHDRLERIDRRGTLTKALLDVGRSSGGYWKAVFSQGIVFAVLAVLLATLPDVVPVDPSPGLTIAAILALGSYTAYNWLCQFEDERFYLRHPVALTTVFRGKLYAFGLLALPVGLGYLALGAALFGAGTLLVGAVVFVPLSLYVFGITGYVAGLQPGELLFDTPTFAAFTGAVLVVLVPIVVLAIAHPIAPRATEAGAIAVALAAGVAGYLLYRRTGTRWERRARA